MTPNRDYFKMAEPFRAKTIEPIRLLSGSEREKCLESAGYNVLLLKSKDVYIDLFTDSGTSAMSDKQWSRMMIGDEAYAGSESFYRLEEAVQDIFGYHYVLPAHQGRAAQNLLYSVLLEQGKYALSNTFYGGDIAERVGSITVNLVVDESYDLYSEEGFKGNINIESLKAVISELGPQNISAMIPVLTNNLSGGHPMSMANLSEVSEICKSYSIPVYLDACRIAENAYFIKEREQGYKERSIKSIVREMASYSDGCIVSGKKDDLCSIGGFLATNSFEVYEACLPLLISIEGFTTCGGLAGRDLEALAVGMYESLDEDYLSYRVRQVQTLAKELSERGVPVIRPYSGSTVYLDAKKFMQHLPFTNYRAESMAAAMYLEGGIRVSPFGQLMSGHTTASDEALDEKLGFLRKGIFCNRENVHGQEVEAEFECVRLAIPRRVYSQSHIDVVREVVSAVYREREKICGLEITYQPRYYRFFSARMKPANGNFWR